MTQFATDRLVATWRHERPQRRRSDLANPSRETVFKVSVIDAEGRLHQTVIRSTIPAERFVQTREELCLAVEQYYQILGCEVVAVQIITEEAHNIVSVTTGYGALA